MAMYYSTTNRMESEMLGLQLTKTPIAKTGMLIRKPPEQVYEAFVNPDHTTKFWFTRSSGKLETGRRIRWEWEMYGVSSLVEVKLLEPGKRITIDWGLDDHPTTVEWIFTPFGEESTFVTITNSGFSGDGDAVIEQAIGSESGFALVLAGLKAYLEYGINLNLVSDRFPERIVNR